MEASETPRKNKMAMENNQFVSSSTGLGGGFKYFFYFHPYLGKMNPFFTNIFSNGLVQPPARIRWQWKITHFFHLLTGDFIVSNGWNFPLSC